jgi:thiol-disulfide isomerase/thioredoxin
MLLIPTILCSSLGFGQANQPAESAPAPTYGTSAQSQNPGWSYYTEPARPANEIKQTYPFDIPLKTAAGDTLNSADVFEQNGKPTVLLFWLTTCMPCRHELAAIAGKFDAWQQEKSFNLYAISVDYENNFGQFVKRVEESNWSFPAWNDVNREFRLVMPGELNGLPQLFVLDKEGKIVQHKRRYRPGDEDALFEFIRSM